MILVAWLLAWAQAVAGDTRPAELQIRAANGAVTIHVQNLPLSQILDRLASATGMNLTYEGARPSTPITMNVEGISEVDAILRLTEGLGVSYVFRTDATGQRVDKLIVSGAGAGSGSLVAAAPSSAAAEKEYEEPVADYGQFPVDLAEAEAAGPYKPDLNSPYLGLPAQHFPPSVPAPGVDPTGASDSRSAPAPPSFPPTTFPPPIVPQGASYPR